MVQFRILSGKRTAQECAIATFPCVIGRSAEAHIRFEEPGVWDRHLEVRLDPPGVFVVKALPNASLVLNDKATTEAPLHNGDVIQAGAVRLQFWLAATRQRSLRLHEGFTWLGLAVLAAVQAGLIFCLLQ